MVFRRVLLLLIFSSMCVDGNAEVVRNQLSLVTQTSLSSERLYGGIVTDMAANRWDRVATSLGILRNEHAGTLISVADRWQMEATLIADLLADMLADMQPTLGLSTGSSLPINSHDAFETWRRVLRGELEPTDILQAVDRSWQSGDIAGAELLLHCLQRTSLISGPTQRDARTGDSDLSLESLKRLIVFDVYLGKFRQAEINLQRFREMAPNVVGKLAGQQGELLTILEGLRDNLREAELTEFLRADFPSPLEIVRYDLLQRRWSTPLDRQMKTTTVLPLHWNDFLLVQNESGVRALELLSGNGAWRIDDNDTGSLWKTDASRSNLEALSLRGRGGEIRDDWWFGRTGVTSFSPHKNLSNQEQSRISALNLTAEGRIEWTLTPEVLTKVTSGSERIFSGPPVVSSGKLYVPLRSSSPENRLEIACLNSATGVELWCSSFAANLKGDAVKTEIFQDLITVNGHMIYWLVDGESLCCLSAETGELQWISGIKPRIDSQPRQESGTGALQISASRIYCTTRNGVAAFDRFSGEQLWEQFLEEVPGQLLGFCDGMLIVSGRDLLGIDTTTGRLEWSLREIGTANAHNIGILLGRSLLFPTGSEILTLDALTGTLLQRDFFTLQTHNPVNGLFLIGSTLLIDTGEELQAYSVEIRRFRSVTAWGHSKP